MKRVFAAASAFALLAAAQADPLPVSVAASIRVTGDVTIDTGEYLQGLVRNFFNDNNNRAIVEYDLASVAGADVDSAIVTGAIEFRQSLFGDDHNWEYYLYPADGLATFDDWDPAGAVLIGTQNSDGTGHTIGPIEAAATLQAIIDGGATHVGFQVRTIGPGRALSELENPGLDVTIGGGQPCPCELDGDAAQVDVFDLLAFLDTWFADDAAADVDGTAGIDVFDLLFYLDCWFPASAGAPCP
jgi:hypothetical protein